MKKNKGIALLITMMMIILLTATVTGSITKRNRNMRLMISKYDRFYFHIAIDGVSRILLTLIKNRAPLFKALIEGAQLETNEEYTKPKYSMYYLNYILSKQPELLTLMLNQALPENAIKPDKITNISITTINDHIPINGIKPVDEGTSPLRDAFIDRLNFLIQDKDIDTKPEDIYNQVGTWQLADENIIFDCKQYLTQLPSIQKKGAAFDSLDEFRFVLALCGIPLSRSEVYQNFRLNGTINDFKIYPNFASLNPDSTKRFLQSYSTETSSIQEVMANYPHFSQSLDGDVSVLFNNEQTEQTFSVGFAIKPPHIGVQEVNSPEYSSDERFQELLAEIQKQDLEKSRIQLGTDSSTIFKLSFQAKYRNFEQQVDIIFTSPPSSSSLTVLHTRIYPIIPAVKKKNLFGDGFKFADKQDNDEKS